MTSVGKSLSLADADPSLTFKHLDASRYMSSWDLKHSDTDCIICEKHVYSKIFYRRGKATEEFDEVVNLSEDLVLR
jgi:thymidylate kinase